MKLAALALCAVALCAAAACGARHGGTAGAGTPGTNASTSAPSGTSASAGSAASASSAPSPSATVSPPSAGATAGHPTLLLDASQWAALRAAVGIPGSLQQQAWQWFSANQLVTLTGNRAFRTYTGRNLDHFVKHVAALTNDGRLVRDLGIAYQITQDRAYADRVRTLLLAWAAVWLPTDASMGVGQEIAIEAGNKQSPGIFDFAWAYDMTAASGVYAGQDQQTLTAWFGRVAQGQWRNLQRTLADPRASMNQMVDYEWALKNGTYLQYRLSDRYGPGGDFALRELVSCAAAAWDAGDLGTLAAIYKQKQPDGRTLAEHALDDALTPHNQGDGRDLVGRPAPELLICKAPLPQAPDTTDYMTYNARTAGLVADLSVNLHAAVPATVPVDLAAAHRAQFAATWTYLARLFQPDAVTSPVHNYAPGAPQRKDIINAVVDTPRFWVGWHETGLSRLLQVLTTGKNAPLAQLYESEYYGPTSLTRSLR